MTTNSDPSRSRAPTFTIGLVQRVCGEDVAQNVARALEGVREAASKGAQIVCLQEMFNTRYFCKAEDHSKFDLAEGLMPPDTGETVRRVRDCAKELGVVIIAPIFEKRGPGLYHNSAAVIDADVSLLGAYRKMHIPDDPLYYEKFFFAPGETDAHAGAIEEHASKVRSANGFKVWRTRYADLGVLICWDQWYPEGARITALLGAEILFYPTAIGWIVGDEHEFAGDHREGWRTIQRSHAIANEVYVAAPNRTGNEPHPGTKGVRYWGSSFVADPLGNIVKDAPVDEEAVLVHVCERRQIEEARRLWPFLRDRRIDAYGPITKRWMGA